MSVNSIKPFNGIGSYFADAQGRSYVLAFDEGQAEPDASECPGNKEPTVTVLETPCVPFGETGSFTIRVTNENDYSVRYMVRIVGHENKKMTIAANSSYDFTFSGYAVGTYDYRVFERIAVEETAIATAIDDLFSIDARVAVPDLEYKWQRVDRGTVELKACPATEVTATAPTFLNPTCEITTGRITVPATEGIVYKIDGDVRGAGTYHFPAGSTVVVTAEAMSEAYILADESTVKWDNTFGTVPENCVLGTTTGRTLGTSLPTTLPATGGVDLPNPLLSIVAGFLTYLFLSRRYKRAEV